MYAGKVCKKCYQGCNNDNNIKFIDEFYLKLEKRFNGYVCSNCVIKMIGGNEELKKLQNKQLLYEMGL